MKRKLLTSAFAIAALAGSANAAVTVTSNSPGVSPYTGAFTFDFDTPGTTPAFVGGAVITTGTTPGLYAQPFGSVQNYFSAGPSTSEPATISIGQIGARTITLLWGSIDTYNTLSFLDAMGNTLASFGGSAIAAPANGSQTDPDTNRIVTFGFTGTDASRVAALQLSSNGTNAFEIDSITISAVPEPAAWALMIGGVGMAGGALRRRRAKVRTMVSFA